MKDRFVIAINIILILLLILQILCDIALWILMPSTALCVIGLILGIVIVILSTINITYKLTKDKCQRKIDLEKKICYNLIKEKEKELN